MIEVTREMVSDIPAPPRTKTWGVLPHGHVINAMDAGCRNIGLVPDGPDFNERFEVSDNGAKMFAVWSFKGGEIMPTIGFRNSTDKTMSWGIASGSMVYVCANMQFHGEYLNYQKHTGVLDYDTAYDFANATIQRVYNKSEFLVDWMYKLREVELDDTHRKAYLYDQLTNGVIKMNQLRTHDECWEKEREVASVEGYSPCSLYAHHNATTRHLNQFNMNTVFERTNTLFGISDDYYNQLAA